MRMSPLASVFFCFAAAAQSERAEFPVERFRPALDANGLTDVEWSGVGNHFEAGAFLFGNYALNPLVLRDDNVRVASVVEHRVGLNVGAALSLFEWVQIGVDMPVVAYQSRDTAKLTDYISVAGTLNAFGIGDLRISPKIRILRARDQFIDLAIMPSVTLPTSPFSPGARGYFGDKEFTFVPELLVSKAFDSGLKLAANLGYRFRPSEETLLNATIGHEILWRAGVGYSLAPALKLPLEIDLTANGGTYTFQPFQSGFEENPLEAILAAKYDVFPWMQVSAGVGKGLISGIGTPDVRVFGGLRLHTPTGNDRDGDGILDDADKCPDVKEDKDEWQDTDGCEDPDDDDDLVLDANDACRRDPEDRDGYQDDDGCKDPDNDGDGVLDDDDTCPTEQGTKENNGCPIKDRDKDGVLDRDDACPDVAGPASARGCPDKDGDGIVDTDDKCPDVKGVVQYGGCPDTDGDGFPDNIDRCPKEPEVINGLDDEDGCPDKGKSQVKLTGEKIEILDKVYFDVNKDIIQKRSYALLNQVASILKTHPELTKVRVEGHTDSDGSDAANLDLSDRRARAVRAYLADRGVEASRLDAEGFGETKPVAPNSNKKNKEKNRRVEFVIVEMNGQPVQGTTSVRSKTE
jgi:large repetitive protein